MFAFDIKVIRTAGNLGEAITDHRDEVVKRYGNAKIFDTYVVLQSILNANNVIIFYKKYVIM